MLVVLGVLLGLAALLAVPVHVAFRLEVVEAFTGRVTVRWLFGLVRFGVGIPGVREEPGEPAPPPRAAEERPRRKSRLRPANVLAALREPALRRRIQRLARDLLGAAHVHGLWLWMRVGLGDPADTGQLWAVLGPVSAAAQGLHSAEIRIEPEFVDPVFELQAHGRLLLVPLQVLALALAFVLSPASMQAWRTLRGERA